MKDFDYQSFWDDSDYSLKNYIDETPTDKIILKVEQELGNKLPKSYIEFMKQHNGGMVQKSWFLTSNFEVVIIEGFLSIGEEKIKGLLGEHGSQFWINEWEYPNIGIYICDTISGGHDMIALDYTECKCSEEPTVVWIAQENEYEKTFLAKNFETFIKSLKDADLMEEFDELNDKVENILYKLLLKHLKSINIKEEIYCLNICYGSEYIMPPFFSFGESSLKKEWLKEIPKTIEKYLWNFAEYGVDEYELQIDKKTQELFDEYNQLATELELWDVQIRTILRVTKKLKNHLLDFNWNMSDDFIVIATDLEQVDVDKNFEFIGNENNN